MTTLNPSTQDIVSLVKTASQTVTINEFNIGSKNYRNELVLFVKPEIFLVTSEDIVANTLEMVFEKLRKFDCHIDGMVAVGGLSLDKQGVMNRHYGYINELSLNASKMVTDEDINKMATTLNLENPESYTIYGGHEYLDHSPKMTVEELDQVWFTKKSIKMRSGFYFQSYEIDGEKVILINGFHPVQLYHFTNPSHRIFLMLIHTNTDWKVLRNEMIGATFPEKAVNDSIRGTLYANPSRYGFDSVSIANNGVHLSAGPFEAAFEIYNFGRLFDVDISNTPPSILSQLIGMGLSPDQASHTTTNPKMIIEGKDTDLFSVTEDMNTEEAAKLWIDYGGFNG